MLNMRNIRRVSLFVSLVLLVAVVVGYLARTAEVNRERDLDLRSDSRVSAERVSSMVDTVLVSVRSGSDREAMLRAFVKTYPNYGICVVDVDDSSCGGSGDRPGAEHLAAARGDLNNGTAAERLAEVPTIAVLDEFVETTYVGGDVALLMVAPANSFGGDGMQTWVRTVLPAGVTPYEFADENGARQYALPVEGLDEVYVTATGPSRAPLPPGEQRFYLIVFVLAVVLFVLASVMMAIDQRNLIERASTDQLTKLPNRGEFEAQASDAVADAKRTGRPLALMIFDLDNFKQINDTHGHHTGDELLETVALRLRRAVRSSEIVARWGGDEFVVVMPAIGDVGVALRRANEVVDAVDGRTRLASSPESIRLRLSAGVALLPDHAHDLPSLLHAADLAMYRAKRERIVTALATASDERTATKPAN